MNDAFAAAPDLLDAFIEQPQTNGVAERFFRPLKEQIIHGRIYRMVAELREAVEKFVDLYNESWLPKKYGFLSPSETRAAVVRSARRGGRRVRQIRVQVSASVIWASAPGGEKA